ncbi:Shikimate kinase I [hydrothermal vent metagenome]|uniref:shikimate kinase n=1 Tax=hydrothermal vent metagenome TaxID=652676 RepID=A0A3B0RC89_9ZZZZ
MKHVWLIGMMGTGKTTVGVRVAASTRVPFIDVDQRIVAETGKAITELFDEGEALFRRIEAAMIGTIAEGQTCVVATGGGAILDPDNVATMRATGTTVLLTAPPDALIARLSGESTDRPLLRGEEDLERIAIEREAIYIAAADIIVDTTSRDVDQVAREVVRCVAT